MTCGRRGWRRNHKSRNKNCERHKTGDAQLERDPIPTSWVVTIFEDRHRSTPVSRLTGVWGWSVIPPGHLHTVTFLSMGTLCTRLIILGCDSLYFFPLLSVWAGLLTDLFELEAQRAAYGRMVCSVCACLATLSFLRGGWGGGGFTLCELKKLLLTKPHTSANCCGVIAIYSIYNRMTIFIWNIKKKNEINNILGKPTAEGSLSGYHSEKPMGTLLVALLRCVCVYVYV